MGDLIKRAMRGQLPMAGAVEGRIVRAMDAFWAIVSLAVVVGVGALLAWVFLIAPFVVPNRHA